MGVPDDANPLNRRLPKEVVTRVHKPEKKKQQEEEAPLETDRAQVLALKPEHRVKWLSKALQKGQDGKVTMTTLYDIVAHTKFGLGASEKQGRNMYKIVRANLSLFSQKQQRFLEGESKLAKDFRSRGVAAAPDVQEEQLGAAASSANVPEADAETGGLGADEIPMLWSRLSTLTAAQCEEAVASLDPLTKSRLEDFLEARMRAKTSSTAAAPALPTPPVQEEPGRSRSRSRAKSPAKSSRSRSRSRSSDGAAKKREPKSKKVKDADRSKRGRSSSSNSSKRSSSSSSTRRRKRSRSRRAKSRRDKK